MPVGKGKTSTGKQFYRFHFNFLGGCIFPFSAQSNFRVFLATPTALYGWPATVCWGCDQQEQPSQPQKFRGLRVLKYPEGPGRMRKGSNVICWLKGLGTRDGWEYFRVGIVKQPSVFIRSPHMQRWFLAVQWWQFPLQTFPWQFLVWYTNLLLQLLPLSPKRRSTSICITQIQRVKLRNLTMECLLQNERFINFQINDL